MSEVSVEVLNQEDIRNVAVAKTQASYGRENADDSFYVCDLGDVVRKHETWLENFPRVHPHYAIKCCTHEPLLACLVEVGCGFDCASKVEIETMIRLGSDPNMIIYANPCKQISHLLYAKKHGVKNVVVDHTWELMKMKEHFPEANIILRIKGRDSEKTLFSLNGKYGASVEDCRLLIQMAKTLELNVSGISFHVGSGCLSPVPFVETLKDAKVLIDYAAEIGYSMNMLDIGGGFIGVLDALPPIEMASSIGRSLNELFPSERYKDLRIIAEPGRYYACSAISLATNIIGKRGDSASGSNIIEYFVNDGIFGSFHSINKKCEKEMECSALKNTGTGSKLYPSCIWGPTCDSDDRVVEKCQLPEMDVGDWIFWKNTGAYTLSLRTDFNGFRTTTIYDVITEGQLKRLQGLAKGAGVPGLIFRRQGKEAEQPAYSYQH